MHIYTKSKLHLAYLKMKHIISSYNSFLIWDLHLNTVCLVDVYRYAVFHIIFNPFILN